MRAPPTDSSGSYYLATIEDIASAAYLLRDRVLAGDLGRLEAAPRRLLHLHLPVVLRLDRLLAARRVTHRPLARLHFNFIYILQLNYY